MKEQYQAFITALLAFIAAAAAQGAYERVPQILLLAFSVCLFLRGVYVMLPFPLNGQDRDDFEAANPGVWKLSRDERVRIYREWENKELKKRELAQSAARNGVTE